MLNDYFDRNKVIACALFACLLTQSPFAAQSAVPDTPIWTRQVLPDLGRTRYGTFDPNRAGIAFLNDEKLIAYGVELDTGRLSSRKSPEISSPFRLHLWLLDAKSGTLASTENFGTRVHDTAVQVTSGGVLVRTGNVLKLYSPDVTKAVDFPMPSDRGVWIMTSVSPSGKTILVNRPDQRQNFSRIDIIDADTRKIKQSWLQAPPLYHDYSISDEGIVVADSQQGLVRFAKFGSTKWDVLGQTKAGCYTATPTFIANESLVMRECGTLVLRTTGGESYSLGSLDTDTSDKPTTVHCQPYDGRMSNKTESASIGRFVAVTLINTKSKRHLFTEAGVCLTGVQIAVYDLSLRKQTLTVNVDPLPTNNYDFALAPDGSKLAILNDGNVSVYSVPVQPESVGDR